MINKDVIECLMKAINLTLYSHSGPNADDISTNAVLYSHYVKIQPYMLFDAQSPNTVLQMIKEDNTREFFLSLTSRFYALLTGYDVSEKELFKCIYSSCNIMDVDPIMDVGEYDSEYGNMLGDENRLSQLDSVDGLIFLSNNRWYAVYCLFILFFDCSLVYPYAAPKSSFSKNT